MGHVITLKPIVLGSKPTPIPGEIVLKAPPGRFQRFLELQPKITPFLAGTLSALTGGGLITAGKVFLGTGLASGILAASPLARKITKEKFLDPTGVGIGIGGIIEDPGKLIPEDQTIGEKIKEIFLTAGLIGAGAAAVAGTGALIGREVKKRRDRPKPVAEIPSQVPAAATFAALPSQVTPQFQQIPGETPAPVEKEVVPEAPAMPAINNKITVSPEINIKFSKSRKFINQQIIVR